MTETVGVTGGDSRLGQHILQHLYDEGLQTVNLSRGKP